ncbi:hypothetical protein E4U43_006270, partial [Claviceps pusilla]
MASQEKNPDVIAYAKTLANVPWCEQYERMISGQLYASKVPHSVANKSSPPSHPPRDFVPPRYDYQVQELIDGRFRARRLMHKYNTYFPDDATPQSLTQYRQGLLEEMLGHIGKNAFIEPPLSIDYG